MRKDGLVGVAEDVSCVLSSEGEALEMVSGILILAFGNVI